MLQLYVQCLLLLLASVPDILAMSTEDFKLFLWQMSGRFAVATVELRIDGRTVNPYIMLRPIRLFPAMADFGMTPSRFFYYEQLSPDNVTDRYIVKMAYENNKAVLSQRRFYGTIKFKYCEMCDKDNHDFFLNLPKSSLMSSDENCRHVFDLSAPIEFTSYMENCPYTAVIVQKGDYMTITTETQVQKLNVQAKYKLPIEWNTKYH